MSSVDSGSSRSHSEKAPRKHSKRRSSSGSKEKKVNFQYFSSKELTRMLLTGKAQDALQYLRSLPEKDLEAVRQKIIRNIQRLQKQQQSSESSQNEAKGLEKSTSSSQTTTSLAVSSSSSGSSPDVSIMSGSDSGFLRKSTSSLTNLGSSALMQAFTASSAPPPGSPLPKRTSGPQITQPTPAPQSLATMSASERANFELAGKYKIGEVLGKGGFGTVLKAVSVETGAFVAIKQIDKDLVDDSQLPSVMKEADILKRLNHTNIVKIYGIMETKTSLYFILEFVESGSLASLVKKYGVFPEPLIAIYVHQTLKGLDYLHKSSIIHRDIKGDNILITKDGKVKLADFGTAKFEDSEKKSQNVVGTPYWMAPEVIEMLPTVGPPSDIWSMGCTVIELLTGAPPYFDLGPMTALFKIVEDQLPPFPQGISEELQDFLAKCFDRDTAKRPAAAQLMEHPFLKNNVKGDAPALDLEQATGTIRMHNQDTLRRRPAVMDMAWGPSGSSSAALTADKIPVASDSIRPLSSAALLMRRGSVRLDPVTPEDLENGKKEKERVESSVEQLRRQVTAVRLECERLSREENELLSKLDAQYSLQTALQKRKLQINKMISQLSVLPEDKKILDTALESIERRFGKEKLGRLIDTSASSKKARSRSNKASGSIPVLRRTRSAEAL